MTKKLMTKKLTSSEYQFEQALRLAKGSERNRRVDFWTLLLNDSINAWYKDMLNKWLKAGIASFVQDEYADYIIWSNSIKNQADRTRMLLRIIDGWTSEIDLSYPHSFYKTVLSESKEAYVKGAESALEAMGYLVKAVEATFTLTNEEILFQIEENARNATRSTSSSLIKSTQRQLIQEVFIDGKSVNGVIDSIADSGVPYWKAKQISETEYQKGLGTARHEMYGRSGVRHKRWISVGDRRVRPAHRANEDQDWIPFNDLYQNGARHVGDGPSSINCRCVEEADLSDPNILLEPWDGR